MRLTVLKIKEEQSRQGGKCWLICFTSDIGTSFKTWIYPQYGNYSRNKWCDVIKYGIGTILEYPDLLINKKSGLLNADIQFKILPKEGGTDGKTTV